MAPPCIHCGDADGKNGVVNIRDGHDLGVHGNLCDACLREQRGPAGSTECPTRGCASDATWFRDAPLDGAEDLPARTARYPLYCDDCAPDALT